MSEWPTAPLGEVASFVRGINFKPDDVVAPGTPGSVSCMRTKNVQAELDMSDVWAVDERFVKRSDQFLQDGDVLVSSANSWNLVGKCSWVPKLPSKATFGGFVSVLRSDPSKAWPRYVYHWFSSDRVQTTLRSFGQQTTNISNLNTDRALRMEFPLPPLAEQRRIAAILDQADALRAKRRQALTELNTLTQSIFLEMFGDPATNPKNWPRVAFGELILDGPQNGIYKPAEDYGSGTPILRIDAFYDGMVTDIRRLKRVRVSEEERDKFGLSANDIVINRVNSMEYLGKSALIPALPEPTVFESNMMRIRVDPDHAAPAYVVQFLQSGYIKSQIARAAKHAVNQSSVNQQDVAAFEIGLPPVPEQLDFVQRCELVAAHSGAVANATDGLNALFLSLQQRAFRGEL